MSPCRVALIALVLAAIPACALDRRGIGAAVDPRMDGGQPGPIDAGPPEPGDAGSDAGVDAEVDGGVDGGVDAGVDAGTDAGTDAGPPPLRPCDLLYAGNGRVMCAERPSECEFNVQLGGSTCTAVCAAVGGACVETYPDGDADHPCDRIGAAEGCDVAAGDLLCVCTRVP